VQVRLKSSGATWSCKSQTFRDQANGSTEVRCALFWKTICPRVHLCHVLQTGSEKYPDWKVLKLREGDFENLIVNI
jgi:hypothetical protein